MVPQKSETPNKPPCAGNNTRKRVCKACDRCRLKKSKCDGVNPCSRCRVNNTACGFSERKKPHDKVYPKGYVEMLEQQQSWLVYGLQELYRRIHNGESWPEEPMKLKADGYPLTHDVLTSLGALDQLKCKSSKENVEVMSNESQKQNGSQAQHQVSSSSNPENAQSPATLSGYLEDISAQDQLPLSPFRHGSPFPPQPLVTGTGNIPQNILFPLPLSFQGVVNLVSPQNSQQWAEGTPPSTSMSIEGIVSLNPLQGSQQWAQSTLLSTPLSIEGTVNLNPLQGSQEWFQHRPFYLSMQGNAKQTALQGTNAKDSLNQLD